MRQTMIHAVARVGLAAIFAYQGLVPKLIAWHADEMALLHEGGISREAAGALLASIGVAELVLALCLLVFWLRRWPPLVCAVLMVLATIDVAATAPRYLVAAFNPVTLNLAVFCLAIVDLIALTGLPSAARCLRRPVPEAE
jgi:uncharacterized membrane protein YphA (DoxX/SURF4 family)